MSDLRYTVPCACHDLCSPSPQAGGVRGRVSIHLYGTIYNHPLALSPFHTVLKGGGVCIRCGGARVSVKERGGYRSGGGELKRGGKEVGSEKKNEDGKRGREKGRRRWGKEGKEI